MCVCADILRKFDNLVEVILPQLPASYEAVPDPEGRAALTWILGEYGEVCMCDDLYLIINTCTFVWGAVKP